MPKIEITILKAIPEITRDDFSKLLRFVCQKKRERIKGLHSYRSALNVLLGDILARVEICRFTGLNNKQLEFSANKYGKPFLLNDPRIHHNISHSGHYIACAVGGKPVGIDVELIKPVNLRIAERFFTPDEKVYIFSKKDGCATRRFFEVWTKKESRVKWGGKGLSEPLSSFSALDREKRGEVYYHRFIENGEADGHLCVSSSDKPIVKEICAASLLRQIMA